MNLNLSSVFSLPASSGGTASNSKGVNTDTYIKAILLLGIIVFAISSASLVEYGVVVSALLLMRYTHAYYKDLTSIDLHFSNDDMELNEIINDLWK